MAALVAGVLAGSIMAAVGGYALYKLLDCIRGKKVAPCSPPESRLLTVERGNRELETQLPYASTRRVAASGSSTLQKRKNLHPCGEGGESGGGGEGGGRGEEEGGQQYRPNARRSLLAKLDDEAPSPLTEPREPTTPQPLASAGSVPSSTSADPSDSTEFTVNFTVSDEVPEPQTELAGSAKPQSQHMEPQSVASKSVDIDPSPVTKPQSAKPPHSAAQVPPTATPTSQGKDKPFSSTTPTSKVGVKTSEPIITPSKSGIRVTIISPVRPSTASSAAEAAPVSSTSTSSKAYVAPTTTPSGTKVPPGAVQLIPSPVATGVQITKSPVTTSPTTPNDTKLLPGAVPLFSPAPVTTQSGIKLPPGAVQLFPSPVPTSTPSTKSPPTTPNDTKLPPGAVPLSSPAPVTTQSGVKLPPGAVQLFPSPVPTSTPSTKSPPTTPNDTKLPPGAVPLFSPVPVTTSSGIKLPPGAVSIFPPAMASAVEFASLQRNSTSKEKPAKSATPKQTPPPVQPKPKSASSAKRDNITPESASGVRLPSSAIRVLPFQQTPPAKRRKSQGAEGGQVPASNGIHTNGVLTNGTGINGNLEVSISFDQPVHDPGLKVATRIKGPKQRRPPTKH